MNECRICLEEEEEEEDNKNDFIKPCSCSTHVHRECIKNWILSENNNSPTDCEVCLNKYSIDFAEMFAEQLSRENRSESENSIISISNNNDFGGDDEEGEGDTIPMDTEIGDVESNQIVPREMTTTERVVVSRILLSHLSRRDRVITERLVGGTLIVSVLDGFLLFVYFTLCRLDRDCQMEVMSVGIAGTLLALFPLLYNSYLKWDNNNIRRNIIDRN